MDRVGCIVVGAGVVGLAVARALALRGTEVIIAEKADAIGTETSSRNSEVIHAGIYYAPGSLKARLCATGRGMLYDYAAGRGVPHRRCGKLIVAVSEEQQATLGDIRARAVANGVGDLEWLEPEAVSTATGPSKAVSAWAWSKSSGRIDTSSRWLRNIFAVDVIASTTAASVGGRPELPGTSAVRPRRLTLGRTP